MKRPSGKGRYYGAAPDAPLYHGEDEPPMALAVFPELADLVAADLYAATALWRFRKSRKNNLKIIFKFSLPIPVIRARLRLS